MYVNGSGFPVIVRTPDAFQQLIPRENPAGIFQEEPQNLKFLQRQLHPLPVHTNRMLPAVHFQPAGLEYPSVLPGAGSAQHSPDPGYHLHHAEGLCQIVVGSQIQTQHLVILRSPGGGHNDGDPRRIRAGAEGFENFNSVHTGKHNVQHNQQGLFFGKGLKQGFSIRKALGVKSRGPQRIEHQLPDAGVIFHTVNHG